MSWLGDSLSNLTGQISNFTKEVLTEGTEEVDDHATELKIARLKVAELEKQCTSHKAEVERLKAVTTELQDKCESADLQINAISNEYRGRLDQKEIEIKTLKQRHNELQEQHSKLVAAPPLAHTTSAPNLAVFEEAAFASDGHDFGDVIAAQHEINRLLGELRRVEADRQHWKQIATQQTAQQQREAELATSDNSGTLQTQIKDLQGQLQDEIDQHQREVAMLQDVHAQKLATLKKKHSDETKDLQDQITEFQLIVEAGGTAGGASSAEQSSFMPELRQLRQRVSTLESENKQLATDAEKSRSVVRDKTRELQRLARQVDALKADKNQLTEENRTVHETAEQLKTKLVQVEQKHKIEIEELRQEKHTVTQVQDTEDHDTSQLQQKLAEAEKALELLRLEKTQVDEALLATQKRLLVQLDVDHACTEDMLHDLRYAKEKFALKSELLANKVFCEKQEVVGQLMQVGAKQQEVKSSMEVLGSVQQQVSRHAADMVDDLGSSQHQQLTAGIMNSMEEENMVLKKHAVDMELKVKQLQQLLRRVVAVKDTGESLTTELTQQLRTHAGSDEDGDDWSESLSQASSHAALSSIPFPQEQHGFPGYKIADSELDSVSEISNLSSANQKLDKQVVELQGQINTYEREIEHFELVKSDWAMEKEALEEVLMKLRMDLREKEDSLNVIQAQKGLVEVEIQGNPDLDNPRRRPAKSHDGLLEVERTERKNENRPHEPLDDTSDEEEGSDLEGDINELQSQLDLLTLGNAQLEHERDLLARDKEKLLEELEGHRQKLAQLERQLKEVAGSDAANQQMDEMKDALRNKDIELSTLTTKLEEKETELSTLATELSGKDKSLNDTQGELSQLATQLQEKDSELAKLAKQYETKEAEVMNLSTQLETQGQQLLNLSSQAEQVEELQSKVSQQGDYIGNISQQLSEKDAELDLLTQQLNEKESQLLKITSSSDSTSVLLQEQIQQLESKIQQTETKLQDTSISLQQKDREITALKTKLEQTQSEFNTVNTPISSDDVYSEKVQKLTQLMQEKESKICDISKCLEEKDQSLRDLSMQLEEKEHTLQNSLSEKESLLSSLEELDDEHQQVLTQMIDKRNQLVEANRELELKVAELQQQKEAPAHDTPQSADTPSLEIAQEVTSLQEQLETANRETAELKQRNASLRKEKDELGSQIGVSREKLERSALALNELHMDKKELQGQVVTLKQQVKDLGEKLHTLRKENTQIQAKLQTKEVETDALQTKASTQDQEELHKMVQQLQAELTRIQQQRDSLNEQVQDLHNSLASQKEQLTENFNRSVTGLDAQIEGLVQQKNMLETELGEWKQKLEEEATQHERQVKDLIAAQQLDATSLQAEHKKLVMASHDKDRKISQLESQEEQLQGEIKDTKDILQSTIDSQQHIHDLLNDKENEIKALLEKKHKLEEQVDEDSVAIKRLNAELQRLADIDKQFTHSVEDCKKVRAELESARLEIQQLHSQEDTGKTLGIITELESEIKLLTNQVQEQSATIDDYKTQIAEYEDWPSKEVEDNDTVATLKDLLTEKEKDFVDLANRLERAKSLIQDDLIQYVDDPQLTIPHTAKSSSSEPKGDQILNGLGPDELSNGDSRVHLYSQEMQQLKTIMSQKDDVILELRDSNKSLLNMLEERSITLFGDTTLIDVHKLENEIKGSQLEKEQIMSVLNEKSRECSSLKSEVHRLMNVVSAEKMALSKLQQDNQELMKKRDDPNADMTKEALKNLSRIIRDKDLELEALKQKVETLLQVLQETPGSQDGIQISTLLQERENLTKQIVVFQNEREQIIAALNQKHQESVAYHAEVQRVTALMVSQNEQQEKLQQEYSNLTQQFEDKSQTLLKVQNELINYKQKFGEIDSKYREAMQRQNSASTVDQSVYNQKCEEISALESQLRQLTESLKAKEHTIEELTKKVGMLQEKDRLILELNKRIVDLQEQKNQAAENQQSLTELSEKESVIAHLKNTLEERNKLINELKRQVNELSSREIVSESMQKHTEETFNSSKVMDMINVSTAELQDRDLIISDLKNAIEKKDKTISDLTYKAAESQQKDRTIEELNRMLAGLHEKDHVIGELNRKVGELENKEAIISDLNGKVGELSTQLRDKENAMREREAESNAIKKQLEGLTFHIQGLQSEAQDLKQQCHTLAQSNSSLQAEASVLQDTNNKLSLAVSERDFEINALREKSNTLAKLVQDAGAVEKGEMERVMQETEAMQKQAQAFQQERDQVLVALQHKQVEVTHLQREVHHLREQEQKLLKELERLRSHLLQVEESYTKEALTAEEREKELRTRLAVAEEKAASSSDAVHSASAQASQQVESLEIQLRELASQRDSAMLQLASAQETANQYATSLANLQMVLEQFQMEREAQQSMEAERFQRALNRSQDEAKSLRAQVNDLQTRLEETSDALEAAQRLSEQLDRREDAIAALREEVQLREAALGRAEEEIHKLSSSNEARVEKVLVKNLIKGYFHTPNTQKIEALKLIGRVLDFSHEDLQEVGAEPQPHQAGSPWIPSIFKWNRGGGSTSPPSSPKRTAPPSTAHNQSFSELFVSFLEKESTPTRVLKLPVEQMAEEQQAKHDLQQQLKQPAFNPFAAPMHASLPLQIGSNLQQDSHLLMKPIASQLPVFTNLVTGEGPSRGESGSNSGRGSANSSGRSTPSSGNLLRDVLQR